MMRGVAALAIVSITAMELYAISKGIDGTGLAAAVGAIAAIVSSISTREYYRRRWYQHNGKG